jgi:hypothetical protein
MLKERGRVSSEEVPRTWGAMTYACCNTHVVIDNTGSAEFVWRRGDPPRAPATQRFGNHPISTKFPDNYDYRRNLPSKKCMHDC